jgi:hypothetical protein
MSDDLEEKVTLFKDKLNEIHENIKSYKNAPIEKILLLPDGQETIIASNLRDILDIIDIKKKCKNYINNIKPHTDYSILDMTTGFGCNEIKVIFNCFKNGTELKLLNDKIREYIEIQIRNNPDSLLLQRLLSELNSINILTKGGNAKVKKINNKTILSKERCIYKKPGDRKEYLKHKGELITVKDYKKLMKDKK